MKLLSRNASRSLRSCQRCFCTQQLAQGFQEKYVYHNVEFSGTDKVLTRKQGFKEPRVPFNDSHLQQGDSFFYPYLQTALPQPELNENVTKWLMEKGSDSEKFVDYLALFAGGFFRKEKERIQICFYSQTEGLPLLIGLHMSEELRQHNPIAKNSFNLSGAKTTVTNPTRFSTSTSLFDTSEDNIITNFYSKEISRDSNGKQTCNISWEHLEHYLENEDGRAQAFLNLVYTHCGQLKRNNRFDAPHELFISIRKYNRSKDPKINEEVVQKVADMINKSWGKNLWAPKITKREIVLNLEGLDSIKEFLEWVGPCVIPGEQHKFVVAEDGLP